MTGQSEWPVVHVQLLVHNTRAPSATNLSDLLLLDNVTGLSVRESAGNQTSRGFQAFRKKFLQGNSRVVMSGGERGETTGRYRAQDLRQTCSSTRDQFVQLSLQTDSLMGASEEETPCLVSVARKLDFSLSSKQVGFGKRIFKMYIFNIYYETCQTQTKSLQ